MTTSPAPSIPHGLPDRSAAQDLGKIWSNVIKKPDVLATLLRGRQLIGHGAYGAIYHVSGMAVKIGYVPAEEAERQAWVHQHFNRALPVLAYASQVKLPDEVTHWSCPIHGGTGDDEKVWSCHCGDPMDVLVMPLAKPAPTFWFNQDVRKIARQVINALFEHFQFFWEDKPSHVLKYQGRIVLADFGEEEVDWC